MEKLNLRRQEDINDEVKFFKTFYSGPANLAVLNHNYILLEFQT